MLCDPADSVRHQPYDRTRIGLFRGICAAGLKGNWWVRRVGDDEGEKGENRVGAAHPAAPAYGPSGVGRTGVLQGQLKAKPS